jgi:hypothetical protein
LPAPLAPNVYKAEITVDPVSRTKWITCLCHENILRNKLAALELLRCYEQIEANGLIAVVFGKVQPSHQILDISSVLLRKSPTNHNPTQKPLTQSIKIIPAEEKHYRFVALMLTRAMVRGYRSMPMLGQPKWADVIRYAREQQHFLKTGRYAALIALVNGRPVGHVTWTAHQSSTKDSWHIRLIDSDCISGFTQKGISAKLVDEIEASVLAKGGSLFGEVSVSSDGDWHLVNELIKQGWERCGVVCWARTQS